MLECHLFTPTRYPSADQSVMLLVENPAGTPAVPPESFSARKGRAPAPVVMARSGFDANLGRVQKFIPSILYPAGYIPVSVLGYSAKEVTCTQLFIIEDRTKMSGEPGRVEPSTY